MTSPWRLKKNAEAHRDVPLGIPQSDRMPEHPAAALLGAKRRVAEARELDLLQYS